AGVLGRGEIKSITVDEVKRMARQAKGRHWSGQGRPAWLNEHHASISGLCLTFLYEESAGCFRCSVTVLLEGGGGGSFALDVAQDEFDSLPDLPEPAVIELAHRFLESFPVIPLDAEQRAEWDRGYGEI
ncbi:hypothetical protein, partial [Nonomuraea sp. PA05]|uniref:hypothetical protein n=1 Tax=Nonomuraea sp. PA05 TaxID=2604466 RepID=UPI001CA3380C